MSVCLSIFLLSPPFLLVFFPPFQQTFIRHQLCMLSLFSRVWLFVTRWTVACQAPLSMGSSRQEYRSGLSCPPPGDLTDPGIKPMSPALQAASLLLIYWGSPRISYMQPEQKIVSAPKAFSPASKQIPTSLRSVLCGSAFCLRHWHTAGEPGAQDVLCACWDQTGFLGKCLVADRVGDFLPTFLHFFVSNYSRTHLKPTHSLRPCQYTWMFL